MQNHSLTNHTKILCRLAGREAYPAAQKPFGGMNGFLSKPFIPGRNNTSVNTVPAKQQFYFLSLSSNISPHSGQNFGGFAGSAGVQPHLLHLYLITAAGRFAPHSEQNLPLFTAPQEHVQVFAAAGSGFFVPQEEQNLPVDTVPHCGHVQPFAAGAAVCCGCCCAPIW